MSTEKRFLQDWNAPGLYRDALVAMAEECKPSAAALKKIVENMNAIGYQFTYHGLKHTWDGDSNRDLLIAMTEVVSPNAEQIRSIIEITTAMGYSFTHKAVSQHLQKLRRTAGDGSTGSAPATPKTPKASKPRAKTTPKSGGKRKTKAEDSSDEHAGVDPSTPNKKMKVEEAEGTEDLSVKNELTSEADNVSDAV